MNTQHPLTRAANGRLILALQNFGNTRNIDHKKCLFALNDSMTSMAEGSLQGRWAFGLPTGTGKTRAIVEWITAVCEAKLPYSVAVAASRIEALCTLKRDLVANGCPPISSASCTKDQPPATKRPASPRRRTTTPALSYYARTR